ncbi:MAG: hypothetical protein WC876_02475, partial [Candidatus Thermoplasmatota archaeon]
MRLALLVIPLLLPMAGCLADGDGEPDGLANDSSAANGLDDSRVVVAVLEFDGTNPYHEDFARPGRNNAPAHDIAGYPTDAVPLRLSLDAESYDEAALRDNDTWAAFQPGVLHYIPGTNIVGLIRFGEGAPLDKGGHNTGTTSLV